MAVTSQLSGPAVGIRTSWVPLHASGTMTALWKLAHYLPLDRLSFRLLSIVVMVVQRTLP